MAPDVRIDAMTNTILILAGGISILLSGFLFYIVAPGEGKPPSALTSTEFRASSVGVLMLMLLIAGVVMLLKGVL